MGFFSSLFSGGLYSISGKDRKAMTEREGYIRYAFRYAGGHTNYPSKIEAVLELSLVSNPDSIINVYANQSVAGLEVNPGKLLFAIPLKSIFKIETSNQKEFAGALLIEGLGAILQETRLFVVIYYQDKNDIKQKVVFGTTPAVKSEAYFNEFYKLFVDTITELNPKALSVETIEESTKSDIASQIAKLSELKEKGMLTDEEFAIAKSKLLKS